MILSMKKPKICRSTRDWNPECYLKPNLADLKLIADHVPVKVGSKAIILVIPCWKDWSTFVVFTWRVPKKEPVDPATFRWNTVLLVLMLVPWFFYILACFKETSSKWSFQDVLIPFPNKGSVFWTLTQCRKSVEQGSTQMFSKVCTPPKTNGWNLKIPAWKRRNIYKPPIFGVPAVSFQRCISLYIMVAKASKRILE